MNLDFFSLKNVLSQSSFTTLNNVLLHAVKDVSAWVLLGKLISKYEYHFLRNETVIFDEKHYFFYKSDDMEKDTYMKYDEQKRCISILKSIGFLSVTKRGVPAKLYFSINYDVILQFLLYDKTRIDILNIVEYPIRQNSITNIEYTNTNNTNNTKEKQVKENEIQKANYSNSENNHLQIASEKVANGVLWKSEPKNDLVNLGQKALSEKEQTNSEMSKNLVLNTKKTENTPPIAPPSDPQTNKTKTIRDKKAHKIALLEQRGVLIPNKQENEKLKPFLEDLRQFIELQDRLFLNKVRKQPLTQKLIEFHEKKILRCLELGANVQEIKDAIETDIIKEYQTIEYGLDKIIKKYEFFSKSVLAKQQQNTQKEQPKPIIKNTDSTKKLD